MNTDMLMKFLKLGLIDLQGSDEKLGKLEATSTSLSEILEADPTKAIGFTLVALNNKASDDDKVVKETVTVLQGKWTTYFNTFSGTPIQIVRALLLQALVTSAEKNSLVALAFVSIVRNFLPHIEIGNEKGIWKEVVHKLEIQLNKLAEEEWATLENITVEKFSYTSPKQIKVLSPNVALDRDALKTGFEQATGPTNEKGEPTNGNPHWSNSPAQWTHEFNKRVVITISDVVDKALEQAKIEPIDLAKPLKDLTASITIHIDNTLAAVSASTAGLQRRTNLIWWKESLYSPSSLSSYRVMTNNVASAVMAFDLMNMIPLYSPFSVTAFLSEAVLSIKNSQNDEQISLRERIEEVRASEYAIPFQQYIDQVFKDIDGCGLLLSLLDTSLMLDEKQFRELTGLSIDTQLSNSEWSMWLFRELQAIRAMNLGGDESE